MGDLSLELPSTPQPTPRTSALPPFRAASSLWWSHGNWSWQRQNPDLTKPPHFLTLAWEIADATQTQLSPICTQQSSPVAQDALEATALPLMAPVIQQS